MTIPNGPDSRSKREEDESFKYEGQNTITKPSTCASMNTTDRPGGCHAAGIYDSRQNTPDPMPAGKSSCSQKLDPPEVSVGTIESNGETDTVSERQASGLVLAHVETESSPAAETASNSPTESASEPETPPPPYYNYPTGDPTSRHTAAPESHPSHHQLVSRQAREYDSESSLLHVNISLQLENRRVLNRTVETIRNNVSVLHEIYNLHNPSRGRQAYHNISGPGPLGPEAALWRQQTELALHQAIEALESAVEANNTNERILHGIPPPAQEPVRYRMPVILPQSPREVSDIGDYDNNNDNVTVEDGAIDPDLNNANQIAASALVELSGVPQGRGGGGGGQGRVGGGGVGSTDWSSHNSLQSVAADEQNTSGSPTSFALEPIQEDSSEDRERSITSRKRAINGERKRTLACMDLNANEHDDVEQRKTKKAKESKPKASPATVQRIQREGSRRSSRLNKQES